MGESGKRPGRVAEFFWLGGAAASAKRLSEPDRKSLYRGLAVGRQRAEAAEALWSNGHSAEGLRLAKQAFEATLEMVGPVGAALRAGTSGPQKPPVEAQDDAKKDEPSQSSEADAGEAKAEEPADEPAEEPAEAKADEPAEEPAEAKADELAEEPAEAKADEPAEEPAEAKADEPADAGDEPEPAPEPGPGPGSGPGPGPGSGSGPGPGPGPGSTPTPEPEPEPAIAAVLAERGLKKPRIDDVMLVEKALNEAELPVWDEDVKPKHGELFQRVVSQRRHVDSVLSPALMSSREIGWARFTRLGGAALVVLAAAMAGYLSMRTPDGIHATASSQWSPDFGQPEWAIDGNPQTEWQTLERQPGWLSITIEPPRRIDTLRVLNGHNRHYNDRATRACEIEIYSNGDLARTIEQTWPTHEAQPEWVEFELGVDQVDRIRVVVRSFHQQGAALAEIEWE